jgi:formylmethanofuran dehydrogenase subunit E
MTKKHRTDAEDKEYYKGVIRKQSKRISALEREVSRLTKYLMRADFEYDIVDETPVIKSPSKGTWECKDCNHTEKSEIQVRHNSIVKYYITCKGCGARSRILINEQHVDTNG